LPLLTKDQIKESLFDTLGVADQDHSIRLSIAAYRLLYRLAQQLLDAGTSLILEANFQHGPSEESLRPLASCARTRLIQCVTSVDEIRRRYDARMAGRTDRHPGHNDAAALPRVLDQLDRGVYQPLDLGVPTLLVDTTTGYHPSLAAIVVWLRCPALAG
jgi:predicted kinase